ncbi:Polynucleotide 5'-hydroxyl-kinase nol9 [Rhizophlyctis rosea]|nr:Polynucleotide 5'-hydroxyl-kinase nol9 [Rhizophlyctis rosea]
MALSGIGEIVRFVSGCDDLFVGVPQGQIDYFKIEGFYPIFTPKEDISALIVPKQWSEICQNAMDRSSYNEPQIICIVGGKNLGKSTFSRVLTNGLLNKYPEVAFLECDIGQSEFTPSGFTSLHVLKHPILGPPFTHTLTPHKSFYLGATSPKNDPDFYIACLLELVDTWRRELAVRADGVARPLVINTHGWIKGMGFDLLLHFLKLVPPQTVVQMRWSQPGPGYQAKNLPPEFADMVRNALRGDNEGVNGSGRGESVDTVQVVEVEGFEGSGRSKYSAPDIRSLSLISYFHQRNGDPTAPITDPSTCNTWWDFHSPLSARIPFKVSWNEIRVKFLNGEVPVSQTLHALNATIVAIVRDYATYEMPPIPGLDSTPTDEVATAPLESTDPALSLRTIPSSIPFHPAMHNAVGLAIVRGIDVEDQVYHVIVGGSLEREERALDGVNMMVRGGGVEMPAWCLCSGYEVSCTTHL